MKIDRYMVRLFFEIKRNLPEDLKEKMAISSPNLGDELAQLYKDLDDDNMKLLISVFLKRAGEDWIAKIRPRKRYYRGIELIDQDKPDIEPWSTRKQQSTPVKAKPKRMYRGRVVE